MLPFWLPEPAVTYLAHTSAGHAIRALARAKGCHASTVLRQVRKVEAWRDDPLVDEALDEFGRTIASQLSELNELEEVLPVSKPNTQKSTSADLKIEREARRILRRLCEKGAFLAVAPNMEKAVVLREVVPGRQNRIAVVDRDVAHAFALQEWISCEKQGKICCYEITAVGRAALKRLLAEERQAKTTNTGFAEEHSPFQEQHRDYADRVVPGNGGKGEKVRYNLAESPLSVLGRKRGKDGKPYLDADLIEAGERLREDFELAQMGASTTQNWESFLTAGTNRGSAGSFGSSPAEGPSDARTRVAKALEAMGPGLSDIVFRVCCFLEGLETAEKRLGWSARSGKVVLKIALDRLATHYRSPGQIQEFRKAG